MRSRGRCLLDGSFPMKEPLKESLKESLNSDRDVSVPLDIIKYHLCYIYNITELMMKQVRPYHIIVADDNLSKPYRIILQSSLFLDQTQIKC